MIGMNRRHLIGGGAALLSLCVPSFVDAAAVPGLTTHMLDVASGKPAQGVKVEFSVWDGGAYKLVKTIQTTEDGRSPEPLLTAEMMKVGKYQLVFYIADYFAKSGTVLPNPPFLETAVVQFGIADVKAHYHVPILATPWTYTTYRGS